MNSYFDSNSDLELSSDDDSVDFHEETSQSAVDLREDDEEGTLVQLETEATAVRESVLVSFPSDQEVVNS